jgi:hypothetical protein
VKISYQTYQNFVKATAVLLLMALFVPTGLHAKQLVDFCKPSPVEQPMAADHSCCDDSDEKESADSHPHQDCDWGLICACNLGASELIDKEWVVANNDLIIKLTESESFSVSIPFIEIIHRDHQIRMGQHAPPIWLMYDSFLI